MASEAQDIPHWSDPRLFRELDFEPQWALLGAKGPEPLPLAAIVERIEAGPGRELWNGQPERPPAALVMRPGSRRPLPIYECPELRTAILAYDEKRLRSVRRRSAMVFYPLLAMAIAAELFFHKFALLPAVFAVITGVEHIEAWLGLRKLLDDPERYLRDNAARMRYSVWLATIGARQRCRACWMVGLWAAIAGVQFFATGESSIAAAGLLKERVLSEPWRLITGPMLHGGVLHLVMNAGVMLSLGPLVERGVHRHIVSSLWLVGAISGSLFSWAASTTPSVGASGGILAIFTFLLVMGLRRRDQLPPSFAAGFTRGLLMIGLLGLLAWGAIDNAAHFGGAVAGAAVGAWMFRDREGALPLADSRGLRIASLVGDSLFVLAAALAIAKLLHLF